ncbi:UvrD-helicase domain-containing protein [Motilimonas sp. KMU-193]|uniref:UvrD-helicase domain-containing protein n=1 Tax=Motilimonas sp. KMU-193 TaxID=3388668 RepID=UPI00396B1FB4
MNDLPNLPSTVQFDSHWYGGFFGSKVCQIIFDPKGIYVQGVLITWQQMDAPLSVLQGSLFDTLYIAAGEHSRYVPWLPKRRFASALKQGIHHWAAFHRAQLIEQGQQCASLLKQGYLRRNQILPLIAQIKQLLKPITALSQDNQSDSKAEYIAIEPLLDAAGNKALTLLQILAQWDEQAIAAHQSQYVEQQKLLHRYFFNTIESNPLTPMQQMACIVNEHSNLVLAGAGCGKTSTLVGRAGYLITSGQATAQQILLLAFGRKAAQEMDQRLAVCLPEESIKSSTFHSLGLHIIASVEGAMPKLTPFVEDEQAKQAWLQQQFNQCLEDASFRHEVVEFLLNYWGPQVTPFDFQQAQDYLSYIQQHGVASLNGELILDQADLRIANWLFMQGISYEYQAPSGLGQHALNAPARLFLPEYQITIITWLFDKHGQVPDYLDQDEYEQYQHTISKQTFKLIENHCCDLEKDTFFDNLAAQLTSLGVLMQPLSESQLFQHCQANGMIEKLSLLLCQMVSIYKACWLEPQALNVRLGSLANAEQMRGAVALLQPILMAYQGYLASRNEIDFDDMIGRAINYVSDGRFDSPWRHILVDEFQDISEPRARLLRALRDLHPDNTLFCVGDDWQAIYRFAGSDVSLTTQFDDYFGAGNGDSAILALDKTFRFNNSIAEISSQFVCQNPAQLTKHLNTHHQVDSPAISLLRSHANNALDLILANITQRVSSLANKPKVLLLARYHYLLPEHQQLNNLTQRFPSLSISAMSVHASKGKEADFVVVLGLEQGNHGFPAQKTTPFLLEALLPPAEHFSHSEERRLFYVALTRAKQRVYLLTNMQRPSPFVLELLNGDYDIELDEFEVSPDQQRTRVEACPQCHTGTLQNKQGKFGAFIGCSHYPFCDYTQAALS